MPDAYIHAPWDAPKADLAAAGVIFGQTYPMRMADHVAAAREARERIARVHRPGWTAPSPEPRQAAPRDKRQAALPFRKTRPKGIRRPARGPVQLSFDLGQPGHASENRPA